MWVWQGFLQENSSYVYICKYSPFLYTKPSSSIWPPFTYCSSVTGLSFQYLMMRRNATVLIIMSLVLACLSQGGCEPQFGETKASISKAPCGGFSVLSLCPLYTMCSSDNQIPHNLLSFRCLLLFFHSMPMKSLDWNGLLYCTLSSWLVNVPDWKFAWCLAELFLC